MKKERNNPKQGISLIVLVITIIVIIILAVAVILSIANNNPIENAKEARFKNDVKAMQEELELLKASNYAKNNGVSYNDPEISIGDLKSATNYQEKFAVKDGELKYIAKKLTGEEQTWASGLGVGVAEEKEQITFKKKGTEELKIGSEVEASNGEQFYVIGEGAVGTEVSTSSTQDILLLAKYNLKEENGTLIQDTMGMQNECAFCSSAAWTSANVVDAEDLNNKEAIRSETTSAVGKAIVYGNKLCEKEGRLMTYEEAEKLKDDYSKILFENYEVIYWLSTASRAGVETGVWYVSGEIQSITVDLSVTRNDCGVRPVIEVPRSSIN